MVASGGYSGARLGVGVGGSWGVKRKEARSLSPERTTSLQGGWAQAERKPEGRNHKHVDHCLSTRPRRSRLMAPAM